MGSPDAVSVGCMEGPFVIRVMEVVGELEMVRELEGTPVSFAVLLGIPVGKLLGKIDCSRVPSSVG